jgi:glycosyltransferase involved in cell wall biosynthesis
VSNSPLITIVTPLFNEERNLPELARRLVSVMSTLQISWEWVAVDDGSSDSTFEIATKLIEQAPLWQLIRLSRNFGQQAAYRAGLEAGRGQAVIFMDADMQDPPEMIPEMIAHWKAGVMQVIGCRRSRPETGVRGLCMSLFHAIFHRITGGVMPKNSGTFALIDRNVANELKKLPERGMFLPAQRGWLGFTKSEVWYDRAARVDEPKQSFSKLFAYAWDGITSFSVVPLQLISLFGIIICLLGFFYALALIVIKLLQLIGYLTFWEVPGFTTVSVAILCLGGIQLLSLGIIGSYLAKVFAEVKQRPHYLVEERKKES